MFSADFDYYRADSVAAAGQLLAAHPGAKLLAGGHSLIPLLKLRLSAPAAVIDIGRIAELRGISADGDGLRIGALTTHAEIAASDAVSEHAAALAEAAGQIGDPAVRNRGTIGGNVAHADPASDLPTVLSALGATLTVAGRDGERSVAAGDFFTGVMTTALGENDLLTSIRVPSSAGRGTAYVKFPHPASRYAVIGVAVALGIGTRGSGWMAKIKGEPKETVCTGAAVARRRPRAGAGALRRAVEAALNDRPPTSETFAAAAAGAVIGDLGSDLLGDVFASGEYRKAVAPVYVRRAIEARGRAGRLERSRHSSRIRTERSRREPVAPASTAHSEPRGATPLHPLPSDCRDGVEVRVVVQHSHAGRLRRGGDDQVRYRQAMAPAACQQSLDLDGAPEDRLRQRHVPVGELSAGSRARAWSD